MVPYIPFSFSPRYCDQLVDACIALFDSDHGIIMIE